MGVIKHEVWSQLHTDDIRYASINLKALGDYGSVEFRAMRGTKNVKDVEVWANLLLTIKDRSMAFDNPIQILELFSGDESSAFAQAILGPFLPLFDKYGKDEVNDMLVSGMRLAQDVAYATYDWDKFLKKDAAPWALRDKPGLNWVDAAQ